jgi:serine/threonine protein kinase
MDVDRFWELANGCQKDSETALIFSGKLIDDWRRHRHPGTHAVLGEYPELAHCKRAVVDLAYEEFCLRMESGEDVDWIDFCEGFPDIKDSLQRCIAVHLAVEENPSLPVAPEEITWPRAGNQFFGYEIIAEIGRGSFARVYRAEEISVGRRAVVIKVCEHQTNEAQILGKLKHPNIIPIHSVKEARSGLTIICMPFVGMFTLHDMLETTYGVHMGSRNHEGGVAGVNERVDAGYVNDALDIGVQLCEALHYLHGKGILHLDVKPSNILIDKQRNPIVLDFNLSLDRSDVEVRMGGTFCYMSPEQRVAVFSREGNVRELDARTDVFSVGVILFELFNGKLPFGDKAGKDVDPQQYDPPRVPWKQPARFVSPAIMSVIDKALQEEPDQRYDSALDFSEALQSQMTRFRRCGRLMRGEPRFLRALAFSSGLVLTAAAWLFYATELYRMFPR